MINTKNLIAGKYSGLGIESIQSTNPQTQSALEGDFLIATLDEVKSAVDEAHNAWSIYKKISGQEKAIFLRTIADEIEGLGDELVQRAMAESGLPQGRIVGERGRTCGQLRAFASHVEEGSWVEAIIEEALPDRTPMPRSDIRKMTQSIGPVAVFTASNFPLAFSTAGGDTASALASGCPVVVKGHPSHLGTNALISQAISAALEKCSLPQGIFSSINGGIGIGQALVTEPRIKAVAFTGSYGGGKSIFDLANSRPEPIPVYAEMGSNNPIFVLDKKMKNDREVLASTIAGSVNLGAGQFCTNPGIIVLNKSENSDLFIELLEIAFKHLQPATMLNEGIYNAYESGKASCVNTNGVKLHFGPKKEDEKWVGRPSFASVNAKDFLENKSLQEEVFGPFTLVVECDGMAQMEEIALQLNGQLTASIMGNEKDLSEVDGLVEALSQRSGRVIFNGVPTGVEVCSAMHHGGPFPSTTNSLFTSVGTDAIKRFSRPVCYQDAPDGLLPDELKRSNPLNIWRTTNGQKSKS